MLTITQATVKYPSGKVFSTKYGDRINAVVTLPDGEEIKLWSNPDDPTLTSLRKGQSLQLAQDAKGRWQLIKSADESPPAHVQNATAHNQPQQQVAWSNEEKRQIATKVVEHAKLMKYCLSQAREHCSEYLETSEDLRAIATTLFLSVTRR